MSFIGFFITMTLKEFLKQNGLNLTSEQRFKIGKRIAQRFNSLRIGQKETIKEDGFNVRTYPVDFLESCSKIILKSIK